MKRFALLPAVLIVACTGALPADEAQDSAYFHVGETWKVRQTTESFSGMPYKIEGGVLQPCEMYEASDGPECFSDVTASYARQEYTNHVTVAARTAIASLGRDGFFVKVFSEGQEEEGSYAVVDDDIDTWGDPQETRENAVFAYVEHNGFLLQQMQSPDLDLGYGETLYPIDPKPGQAYASADGRTWAVLGEETVTIGDKQWGAVAVTNAVEQSVGMDLKAFVRSCILVDRPEYDPGYIIYAIDDTCENRTIVGWDQLWIQGSQLIKRSSYRETIEFYDVGVRNEFGWVDGFVYEADATGPVVVTFSIDRVREESELLEWSR